MHIPLKVPPQHFNVVDVWTLIRHLSAKHGTVHYGQETRGSHIC